MSNPEEESEKDTGFIPVSVINQRAAQAYMAVLMIRIAEGFVKGINPGKMMDESVMELAALLSAREMSDEMLVSVMKNITGRSVGETDTNRRLVLRPNEHFTEEEMDHLLSIRDDKQAVELFIRTRPKVMAAVEKSGITLERAVDAIVRSIQSM